MNQYVIYLKCYYCQGGLEVCLLQDPFFLVVCLALGLMRLAQHIIDTAKNDSSHFVAVLSSVYLSLLAGRKVLNIQGVFGAGKPCSVTLLMVWLPCSTNAKIIFLSKENLGERAIEDLMMFFAELLPTEYTKRLSRVIGAQESERRKRPRVGHERLDSKSRKCSPNSGTTTRQRRQPS